MIGCREAIKTDRVNGETSGGGAVQLEKKFFMCWLSCGYIHERKQCFQAAIYPWSRRPTSRSSNDLFSTDRFSATRLTAS